MITLKTLPQATEQEVFDQIKAHLLSQKVRSILRGNCRYHASSGLKCAAGCLISEDEYSPLFEKRRWGDLVEMKLAPGDHEHLISKLQDLHDRYDYEHWVEYLSTLENFKVEFNI